MLYWSRILFLFLITTLIINGCILERIFRVKDQLCDFDNNFTIEISQGFRVLLKEPVMLDDDITWLTGAEPSIQEFDGDELTMTYIAEKRGGPVDPQYDIPIKLRFIRIDQDYRLKEGYLSKNLTDILSNQLLTQIMQSVCKSKKSLVQQKIIIDISTINQSLLPNKFEIVRILGPPTRDDHNELSQVYEYQLKNHNTMNSEITIELLFDQPADQIRRIKLKFLRYNLNADFDKGEAILKVDIFREI